MSKLNQYLSLFYADALPEGHITLDDVKGQYRKLCKQYHPDINPNGLRMMQIINELHGYLLQQSFPISADPGAEHLHYCDDLAQALEAIRHCTGLVIEVCGTWVWVSGETRQYKDVLKEAGYRYAPKKRMWSYAPASTGKKFYRGKTSMDEIRTKYGSNTVRTYSSAKIGG